MVQTYHPLGARISRTAKATTLKRLTTPCAMAAAGTTIARAIESKQNYGTPKSENGCGCARRRSLKKRQ
jgi:hypothetical protein